VFDAQDGLQFDVLRNSVDAGRWNDVTTNEVSPRGMTPLYDAIGRIVSLAEKDRPEKAIIVIMTDGEEKLLDRDEQRCRQGRAGPRTRPRAGKSSSSAPNSRTSTMPSASAQTSSRNMAVSKDQLSDSMDRLADKSKAFAAGAAPSIEWNNEDRAAAKEGEVQQRNNQGNQR
jgi:hypothetical protein